MAEFRNFAERDYTALCTFFKNLNREQIHWNWARFEWMYVHPEFDKTLQNAIGLWWDEGKIVAAAVYDMYFGEAKCAVLPGYEALYSAVLDYAYENLRDDSGLGIAICDDCAAEIRMAEAAGFEKAEQDETVMEISLDGQKEYTLPSGFHFETLDPVQEPERFSWLLWQGFDHGTDREEFLQNDPIMIQNRPNLNLDLSIAVVDDRGEDAGYCCLWYDADTDYAYVEPVCVVPAHRGKGVGSAAVTEALNRAANLGARSAYVISDLDFYACLGFHKPKHYTFYWKK